MLAADFATTDNGRHQSPTDGRENIKTYAVFADSGRFVVQLILFQLSLSNQFDMSVVPECLERSNSWQPPKGPFWLG